MFKLPILNPNQNNKGDKYREVFVVVVGPSSAIDAGSRLSNMWSFEPDYCSQSFYFCVYLNRFLHEILVILVEPTELFYFGHNQFPLPATGAAHPSWPHLTCINRDTQYNNRIAPKSYCK